MIRLLITFALLLAACGPYLWTVRSIVDGDTITVGAVGANKTVVRYIGIDTPDRGECMWTDALVANYDLVQGKDVLLVSDKTHEDKYGRWLRYVLVDGIMVQEELLRRGLARAASYEPDTTNARRFQELENTARSQQLGIWGPACR